MTNSSASSPSLDLLADPDSVESAAPSTDEPTAPDRSTAVSTVEDPPSADDRMIEAETEKPEEPLPPPRPKGAQSSSSTPARPEPENVRSLRLAMNEGSPVEGKVIGWNNGGFHVVVQDLTAFCPRSEMEIAAAKKPESYLDKSFSFSVLKIQRRGKRIVLSRSARLKAELRAERQKVQERVKPGVALTGRVASLTDFGAFVDLDGIQGLVHISELSRVRVDHPSEVVEVGQQVEVKVLRIEGQGKRISLSMKALEPDPWDGIEEKLQEGVVVTGTVERTANFGAFVRVAPGLTGLLPASGMSIPRDTSPARAYPAGKEIVVQILGIDRRRRRISLALEGSAIEGTQKDFESYRQNQVDDRSSFNALAAALEKARRTSLE